MSHYCIPKNPQIWEILAKPSQTLFFPILGSSYAYPIFRDKNAKNDEPQSKPPTRDEGNLEQAAVKQGDVNRQNAGLNQQEKGEPGWAWGFLNAWISTTCGNPGCVWKLWIYPAVMVIIEKITIKPVDGIGYPLFSDKPK